MTPPDSSPAPRGAGARGDDPNKQRLEREEFYVGYFPTPPGLRRFGLRAAAAAAGLLLGLGLLIAATQRDPGPQLAPYRPGHSLQGVVVGAPYPHLRLLHEDGRLETVLLVGGAKHDAKVEEAHLGHMLRLDGNLLERAGTRMLEGPGGYEAVATASAADLARLIDAPTDDLGEVHLQGEIVDSKCFFGRMKPGEGRAHRACAQLCIAGGVPPVFVTRDREGEETHYMLVDRKGAAVKDAVVPFAAEPVHITGQLTRRAGMLILSMNPSEIERL